LLFVPLISCIKTVGAQTVQLEQFSSGYNWLVGVVAAPGENDLFILQQNGYIYRCSPDGVKDPTPFLNISSKTTASGERGLLGLAFSPNYAQNGQFYVNYTAASGGATRVARYERSAANPLVADPNSEVILLTIAQPYNNHNGGCIQFDRDGYLQIGMGDGGSAGDPQNNGQKKNALLGKMLRIDVDNPANGLNYGIPASNPFVNNADYLPEIWSLGWRNHWRFSFDRLTGDMWAGDVGQNAWEEVNMEPYGAPGGLNYGWRCYEADAAYNTNGCAGSGFVAPVFKYAHSGNGCSITGGYVYRGALHASLFGKYLVADYCSGRMWAVSPQTGGGYTSSVVGNFAAYTITSFGEDQYGELYTTNYSTHVVNRIVVNNDAPVALITNPDTVKVCATNGQHTLSLTALEHPILSYQWQFNGTPIDGQTNAQLELINGAEGAYQVVVTAPNGQSSTSQPVEVQVVAVPATVPIIGNVTPCANKEAQLYVEPVEGATYQWIVTGGTIVEGQGTPQITVLWGSDGQGSVEVLLSF
jgi:glucose/arabinose dehydrogenase